MNGFKMLADSYRKAAAEGKLAQEQADKECKVLDFLATCNEDDFYSYRKATRRKDEDYATFATIVGLK